VAEGIPADNPHFVLLFFITQLFLRELAKCHRLVQVIPMDMSGYYGKSRLHPATRVRSRPRPSPEEVSTKAVAALRIMN
jgi:hypothetical protein